MPAQPASDLKFEIGHVLFIDIVGYSKLLINEQSELIRELKEIVRETEQVRLAEAESKLVRLPTGDGMALVFRNSPEAPVQCALEISQALKAHPQIQLRMGIHSGPVNEVVDVNERTNITGAGINIAQRVMDCGDAGHILLSKRVADDLEQYPQWRSCLHDLGECEVKHGVHVSVINLYTDELGNPEMPEKFKQAAGATKAAAAISGPIERPTARRWAVIGAVLLMIVLTGLLIFPTKRSPTGAITSTAIPEKSIAVLPFENLSHDPENAYFADGIQEEILTRLSKIADLKVVSRTSTQRYKSSPQNLSEIARQLGVAHVLEGSAQRVADQVRVNVQLINAANDAHLWAETYDRKLTDIFAVESDIAKTVAESLQAKLTGAEERAISSRPTENPEAHLLYLKGRYHVQKLSKEELDKGLDYFKHAIALDPQYALAYDGIAYYYFVAMDWLVALSEAGPRFMEAARRAVELDDTLAEAHTELANAYFWYDWDWAAAEREFKRAIQSDPRYSPAHEYYGWCLVSIGRVDEGLAEIRRAQEIDPLSVESNSVSGWNLWLVGRYDEATRQLQKALDLDPNYWWAHSIMGRCYLGKRMPSKAITEFHKARSLESTIAEPLAGLGLAYAADGNNTEAMKVLDELQELAKRSYVSPYFIAIVYVGLGEKDQAFAWLDKAYENRSWYLRELKVSPAVDSLRSDPRFKTLIARVFSKEQ